MAGSTFDGFPAGTMKFLKQLKQNNDRDWFNENKPRYESHVREPALAFIEAMQKPMGRLSECVDVVPKKVGGSLMRVYRDTRFSKDKTPYKTNVGIQFRHMAGKDVHSPGFYVHIEPGEVFLGAGIWHPDSTALAAIRDRIDEDPAVWKRVRDRKAFRSHFALTGDSLKRPPRGFDPEHPMIEDLKRKDFIGVGQLEPKSIESPDFVTDTAQAFKVAIPFVRFLCGALNLPL
jgi:uncharacterized protein (TIGR02453 family)